MAIQAALLAILVAVVGMPHGGLDHRIGRGLMRPRFGAIWPITFALGYLAAMLLVLFGWSAVPLLTLAGFVLLSALHFGSAEVQPGGIAIAALRGIAVVWIPALFQPAEFTRLLVWVVPGDGWPEGFLFDPGVRMFLAISVVVYVLSLAAASRISRLVGAAFLVLFAVAPPLVSFALYFCGWHSTVELLRLARLADPGNIGKGLVRVISAAAPLSVLAVVFGVAGWFFAASRGPLTPGLVRVIFVGLSVVAVPHILLNFASARKGINPFAPGILP